MPPTYSPHRLTPQHGAISSLHDNGFGHRPRAGSKSAGRPDARSSANPLINLYDAYAETLQLEPEEHHRLTGFDWSCIAVALFSLAYFVVRVVV